MNSAMTIELTPQQRRRRLIGLFGLTLTILVLGFLTPPFSQPLEYHDFADQRRLLGVPHMWNVVSNVPFAVIGALGCWWLLRQEVPSKAFADFGAPIAYFVFFFGEFLTCFGSAYYHANPNNATLVWDRLVFSLLLTSFFAIVVVEFVSDRAGKLILAPMILLGLYSVLYWHWSELAGEGDVRLYLLVQFCPVIVVPFIVCMFPPRHGQARQFVLVWALFAVAKICELFDAQIYVLTGFWSGHTLKHLIAAVATYCLFHGLRQRQTA